MTQFRVQEEQNVFPQILQWCLRLNKLKGASHSKQAFALLSGIHHCRSPSALVSLGFPRLKRLRFMIHVDMCARRQKKLQCNEGRSTFQIGLQIRSSSARAKPSLAGAFENIQNFLLAFFFADCAHVARLSSVWLLMPAQCQAPAG